MLDPSHVPRPGDVSLCLRCCEWVVFDEALHLRKPMPQESVEFANSWTLQRLMGHAKRSARERALRQ